MNDRKHHPVRRALAGTGLSVSLAIAGLSGAAFGSEEFPEGAALSSEETETAAKSSAGNVSAEKEPGTEANSTSDDADTEKKTETAVMSTSGDVDVQEEIETSAKSTSGSAGIEKDTEGAADSSASDAGLKEASGTDAEGGSEEASERQDSEKEALPKRTESDERYDAFLAALADAQDQIRSDGLEASCLICLTSSSGSGTERKEPGTTEKEAEDLAEAEAEMSSEASSKEAEVAEKTGSETSSEADEGDENLTDSQNKSVSEENETASAFKDLELLEEGTSSSDEEEKAESAASAADESKTEKGTEGKTAADSALSGDEEESLPGIRSAVEFELLEEGTSAAEEESSGSQADTAEQEDGSEDGACLLMLQLPDGIHTLSLTTAQVRRIAEGQSAFYAAEADLDEDDRPELLAALGPAEEAAPEMTAVLGVFAYNGERLVTFNGEDRSSSVSVCFTPCEETKERIRAWLTTDIMSSFRWYPVGEQEYSWEGEEITLPEEVRQERGLITVSVSDPDEDGKEELCAWYLVPQEDGTLKLQEAVFGKKGTAILRETVAEIEVLPGDTSFDFYAGRIRLDGEEYLYTEETVWESDPEGSEALCALYQLEEGKLVLVWSWQAGADTLADPMDPSETEDPAETSDSAETSDPEEAGQSDTSDSGESGPAEDADPAETSDPEESGQSDTSDSEEAGQAGADGSSFPASFRGSSTEILEISAGYTVEKDGIDLIWTVTDPSGLNPDAS